MRNTCSILLLAFTAMLLAACGNNDSNITVVKGSAKEMITDPLLIEIHSLEKKTKEDTVFDRNTGLRLLQAYQTYYNQHGKDSLALHYLFEGGRVASALGKYQKAIDMFITYHDLINDEEKKAEAAYLVAFSYDAHLNDSEKAIEYYNKVIERYPRSKWAEQSKAALHLVGKSDEELIKFLQERNKVNS
ncbi:MAG TPA: tetratricopeptide repeat protein [Flavobacteriales bacterium]